MRLAAFTHQSAFVLLLAAQLVSGRAVRGQPSPEPPLPLSNLRVGAAKANITPPAGIELAGYADRQGGSTGVHDPLEAACAVFDDGERRAAIIAFDLLQLLEDDGRRIRGAIREATGIGEEFVLLNASHTHGAPLLRTDQAYRQTVMERTVQIVKDALDRARPASLGYGEGQIDFNISRRFIGPDGKIIPGPLNPDGPCDRRLKVLRIDDGAGTVEPVTLIMSAACHPNVFRGSNRQISADFVGIGRAFVEKNFEARTIALFLQGCSGDLRANMPPSHRGGWRNGSKIDMAWCGWSLGAEAIQVAAGLRVREQAARRPREFRIAAGREVLLLTPDPAKLERRRSTRDRIEDGKIVFPIQVLRIGHFIFVSLPGEPVVEYGFGIEEDLKEFGQVMVLGYGPGDVGYVPVKHQIDEGGYETEGPYGHSSEEEIRSAVKRLVRGLR